MTTATPSPSASLEGAVSGVLKSLRGGLAAATRYVDESGVGDRVGPVVSQGKEATATGLTRVNQIASAATDAVTNKDVFARQDRLNDLLVDVMSAQQGLIEELRARVQVLESAR